MYHLTLSEYAYRSRMICIESSQEAGVSEGGSRPMTVRMPVKVALGTAIETCRFFGSSAKFSSEDFLENQWRFWYE